MVDSFIIEHNEEYAKVILAKVIEADSYLWQQN